LVPSGGSFGGGGRLGGVELVRVRAARLRAGRLIGAERVEHLAAGDDERGAAAFGFGGDVGAKVNQVHQGDGAIAPMFAGRGQALQLKINRCAGGGDDFPGGVEQGDSGEFVGLHQGAEGGFEAVLGDHTEVAL
jgi:hypothetical protein